MLHLIRYNKLMRMAMGIFCIGLLYIILLVSTQQQLFWLLVLCVFVGLLALFAFVEEYRFKKTSTGEYIDLALLLEETKKMEHFFTMAGGEGKGLYEKAANLLDPQQDKEFLEDIFAIATVRNEAMHNDPKIKNAKDVIKHAKKINAFLEKNWIKKSYKMMRFFATVSLVITPLFLGFFGYTCYTHDAGKLLLIMILSYGFGSFVKDRLFVQHYLMVIVTIYGVLGYLLGGMCAN